jgi:hypothetical protein
VAIVRSGQIVADETMDALRRRAHRAVVLRFRSDATTSIEPPDFLKVEQSIGQMWRCELTGTTPQLVAWAAGQALEDLEVGPPSLEGLFRRYYQLEEELA